MFSFAKVRARFLMVASLGLLLILSLRGWQRGNAGGSEPNASTVSSLAFQEVHDDARNSNAKVRLQQMDQMPLYFVENRGQLDSRVAFYLQGRDKSLYFTERGITFVLTDIPDHETVSKGGLEKASFPHAGDETVKSDGRWVVKLDFVGSNPKAKIAAEEKTPAVISYFKGSREQWRTGLPTWRRVVYSDLWPGIDLVYEGTANRLKYSFRVRPGANPEEIRLAYRGAAKVGVSSTGRLEVETPRGGFEDDAPSAYQEVDGRRTSVNVAYAVGSETAGRYEYGLDIGSYDRGKTLVLDPAVLIYAGYIGGEGPEYGQGIAVDGFGNAYVTGYALDSLFPVKVGPDLTYPGSWDAFVAKVNAAGTGLDYSGFIGGIGYDRGYGIAVDDSGNAYVTGFTDSGNALSGETSFPVTVGPDLTFNGGRDAFVAKVNAAGTGLDYAGFIGGLGTDQGYDVAVDGTGHAYVTGDATSLETTFPVTVGPDLTRNGDFDAFVAKVSADGTGLDYAGYVGGSSFEHGFGIALDASGNAYIAGNTGSSEATFPVKIGPDLTYNGSGIAGGDVFVAKVNAGGTGLDYAGYIGGSDTEYGHGIAVDSFGNAYVTGRTFSSEGTFPVTVGPDLTYNGSGSDFGDAFVAKVNAAGTGLDYAGYIGGSGGDTGESIAVDGSGNAYVTGFTESSETTFPVTVGPDLTFNGDFDAFVAKVNAAGTGLQYAGYIGGSDGDVGRGIAVDASGNAYVIGQASSSESTFPVTVGPDLTLSGGPDVFVAKVAEIAARFEGCAAGFWKQTRQLDDWVAAGFSPSQSLESVFDVPDQCGLDSFTLLQALNFKGGDTEMCGASRILLRSAVAALLNSGHPDVDYPLTTAQVIAGVNAALASGDRPTILALASELDASNNLGSDLCGFPPTPTPTPIP
jgi:Beta-propeller repeat